MIKLTLLVLPLALISMPLAAAAEDWKHDNGKGKHGKHHKHKNKHGRGAYEAREQSVVLRPGAPVTFHFDSGSAAPRTVRPAAPPVARVAAPVAPQPVAPQSVTRRKTVTTPAPRDSYSNVDPVKQR